MMISFRRVLGAWMKRAWLVPAIALLVVTSATAIAGAVWVTHYDAIELGSTTYLPGVRADPSYGDHTNTLRSLQEGQRVDYGYTIRNRSRFTVTVTDAPLSSGLEFGVQKRELMVGPRGRTDGLAVFGNGLTPFQPFSLAPDEQRGLGFRFKIADCESFAPGGGLTVDHQEIRYTLLGIPRSTLLELPHPLVFTSSGPSTPQCPYLTPGLTSARQPAVSSTGSIGFTYAGSAYRLTMASYRYLKGSSHCVEGSPVGLTIDPDDPDHAPVSMALYLSAHYAGGGPAAPLTFDTAPPLLGPACATAAPLHVTVPSPGERLTLAGTVQPPAGAGSSLVVHGAITEGADTRDIGDITLTIPAGPEPAVR